MTMKKLRGSLTAKIAAIILLTCTAFALVFSAAGIAVLAEFDAYPNGYERLREQALDTIGTNYNYHVGNWISSGTYPDEIYKNSNYRFNIYDSEGTAIYEGYTGGATIWEGSTGGFVYYYGSDTEAQPTATPTPEPTAALSQPSTEPVQQADAEESYTQPLRVTVTGYIMADMAEEDNISFTMEVLDTAYEMRYDLIAVGAVSLLLSVMLFIFLLCSAGHRDESDTVTLNVIDKIPFDLFTAIIVSLGGMVAAIVTESGYWQPVVTVITSGVMLLAEGLLVLLFFMSLAARLKAGGIIKGCIIYRVLRWCWRLIKTVFGGIWRLIRSLPLIKKAAIIIGAVLLVEFLYLGISFGNGGAGLLGWFMERLILVPLLIYVLLCMKKLREGARAIAGGDMDYTVDTKHMYGELKAHAEDLNNIREGMQKAVDERMKSERFKTELITNVSHDIKTPLTSIVNYVDLLEKEKPENEKMREYIDVLSRQSARLKKLIDDLIEASKASTGNLNVNFERCELGVLLDQTAGEYGEKLTNAGLELVLTKPEKPVTVMADGRHMWRIFDNLMSNVCKYAQPGTRVYLSLEKSSGKALLVFRNISKSKLNISGDELMERFVRGDGSRNTEGSGLGLSIAKSLVQLQKGEMELKVDGDLFKVILTFTAV